MTKPDSAEALPVNGSNALSVTFTSTAQQMVVLTFFILVLLVNVVPISTLQRACGQNRDEWVMETFLMLAAALGFFAAGKTRLVVDDSGLVYEKFGFVKKTREEYRFSDISKVSVVRVLSSKGDPIANLMIESAQNENPLKFPVWQFSLEQIALLVGVMAAHNPKVCFDDEILALKGRALREHSFVSDGPIGKKLNVGFIFWPLWASVFAYELYNLYC